MYRYRDVFSILNKNDLLPKDKKKVENREKKTFDELRNQSIFLSNIQKDSLEGNRIFYWMGDEILWENFFKYFYFMVLDWWILQIDDDKDFYKFAQSEIKRLHDKKLIEGANFHVFENITGVKKISHLLGGNEKIKLTETQLEMLLGLMEYFIPGSYNNGFKNLTSKQLMKTADEITEFAIELVKTSPEILLIRKDQFREIRNKIQLKTGFAGKDNHIEYSSKFIFIVEKLFSVESFVACFTRTPTNAMMWERYADCGNGIVLEFRSSDSLELKERIDDRQSFVKEKIEPIVYDLYDKPVNFFQTFGHLRLIDVQNFFFDDNGNKSKFQGSFLNFKDDDKRISYWRNWREAYLHKDPSYAGEQEARVILQPLLGIDSSQQLTKYKFSELKSITFGESLDESYKELIRKIINDKMQKNHIKNFEFYQFDGASGRHRSY